MGRVNNSIASMIRGKSVEEAIRFAFFNHKDKFSIKAAQNYANDLYYLRTKFFAKKIVKDNAKPINSLVRVGVNTFFKLGVKNLKNVDSFKIKNKQSAYFIFPDFVSNICDVNNKKIKNCCVELKVSNKKNRKISRKHVLQCYNYSTQSRKPVVLIYLFFGKKPIKSGIYEVNPKIFIIFNNKMRKLDL